MTDFKPHPWQLGASESGALLRSRALKSVDLAESVLERHRVINTEVNAVVACFEPQHILAEAREADRRLDRGQPAGPLDGIPLTVKDNLWVQGLPATWGIEVLRSFMPPKDDAAVSDVCGAGAIVMGKTNVPAMALAATTGNEIYGVTRNPLSLDLTPGGSSGGAAAALAVGIGALALATDAGGSIRRPAAYTSTVGFKPSNAAVLASSGFPRTALDFQVVGPMARSVEDCALMMAALAVDPQAFPWRTHTERPAKWLGEWARSRRARVLAITPPPKGQDPTITQALHSCAERLARAGHQVDWKPMPYSLPEVESFWSELLPPGVSAAMDEVGLDQAVLPKGLQDIAQRASKQSVASLYRTVARLLQWRQELRAFWFQTDVILSPTSPCLAWTHADPYPASINGEPASPRDAAIYAVFANAAGAPSISVPVPGQAGVGIQLTGAPGHDAQLLAWAWECEQLMET